MFIVIWKLKICVYKTTDKVIAILLFNERNMMKIEVAEIIWILVQLWDDIPGNLLKHLSF